MGVMNLVALLRHRPKVLNSFKINLKYILLLTNINLFPPLKALLSSYMNQKLIFLGLLDVLKVPNHEILVIRFNLCFIAQTLGLGT